MKKFWNLMLAALVIFGAVACTEKEVAPEQNAGMSIYATINAEQTRVDVVQDENYDTNKKWNTIWTAGDMLEVYSFDDDTFFYFENSADNVNKFTCNEPGVNDLIGDNVVVAVVTNTENRSTSYNSEKGKQGAEIGVEIENFNPANTINLQTQTAFLRYSSNYEITLEASDDIFYDKDDNNVNTITLPASEEDVWVAVWPYENITLSYSIGEVKYKEITTTFEAGKIYNLGFLGAKSEYGVVGSFQGWDPAASVAMYEDKNEGWVVAKNIELYKDDEIKIVKGSTWGESYGLQNPDVVAVDKELALVKENSQNILVAKNGKFNIYFNDSNLKFKYECVEEYTNLMVDITIDNKANWSPLTMTLKDGNTVIADKVAVTGNKYTVSGEHIGKTLTYQFFTNGKQTDEDTVNITHTGATVIVKEPAAVKNMVYLKPGVWTADGAWFAAYFWDPAAASWKKMVYNTAKAVYECEVPDNCGSVIFCRMDSGKTNLDWSSKWNQTNDITNLKSNIGKCCVITGWNGNDYKWENL